MDKWIRDRVYHEASIWNIIDIGAIVIRACLPDAFVPCECSRGLELLT